MTRAPYSVLVIGSACEKTEALLSLLKTRYTTVLVKYDMSSALAVLESFIIDVVVVCGSSHDGVTIEQVIQQIHSSVSRQGMVVLAQDGQEYFPNGDPNVTVVRHPGEPAAMFEAIRRCVGIIRKVLVVTDDTAFKYRTEKVLRGVGVYRHRILTVSRLPDAMLLTKLERLHVVVLDCRGRSSDDAAGFRRKIHRDIPVVSVVTTNDQHSALTSASTLQHAELESRLGPVIKRILSVTNA